MNKLKASDRIVVMDAKQGRGAFAKRTLDYDSVVGRIYGQVTDDDTVDPRY